MPKYLTDNTQLKCDKGTIPAPLSVTSQTFMQIEGKLQATEEDKIPNVNIKPFGVCSITRSSCVPAPVKWENTSPFEIDGKKELLDTSTCQCSVGGKITPIKSEQSFVVENEESIYQPIVYTSDDESNDKYNGYYYNYNGNFEGKVAEQKKGNESDVYACKGKGNEQNTFTSPKKLKITHTDFQRVCDIVMKEAGKDDLKELKCIAFTSYNRSVKAGKSWRGILDTSYSSVPDKSNLADTNKSSKANHTRSVIISVLSGEKDITKGAEYWDGTDFLAWGNSEQNPYNKLGQNKFDEYKFIEIPKNVYDDFIDAHGSSTTYPDRGNHTKEKEHGSHEHIIVKKNGKDVKKIKYPLPASEFTDEKNWKSGNFYYETGVKTTNGISGTISAGKSIFWKLTPNKLFK